MLNDTPSVAAEVLPAATQLTRYRALVAHRATPPTGWLWIASLLQAEVGHRLAPRQEYTAAIDDCVARAAVYA